MEVLITLLQIALPAAAIMYGMYLTIKTFLQKEFEKRMVDVRLKNKELILPTRLQAYERICLLLERISPSNIVPRVNDPSFSAGMLHARLLAEIRNELNHNLSQQVYMSDQAWNLTKKAVEDINTIINSSAKKVNPEGKGIELAKAVFETMESLDQDPIAQTLTYVKNEIRALY